MIIVVLWVALAFVVAAFGGKHNIGFGLAFILSIIFSPLIGLICVLISDEPKEPTVVLAPIPVQSTMPVIDKVPDTPAYQPKVEVPVNTTPSAPPIYKESLLDKDAVITFEGKNFCITGDALACTREEFAEMLEEAGANVTQGVSRKTNYLIICEHASDAYKFGNYGAKTAKALELNKTNVANIVIISEYQVMQALKK
jgi:hypothetical protein